MKKEYTILVVDDVKANVDLLKLRLEKEGYHILSAYNGIEALKILEYEKPDLILSDIIMPEMDGFELCKLAKTSNETRNIPFVMITSLTDTSNKVKGLEAGCDDFLPKPINDIELTARVKSLLRIKDYTEQLAAQNIIFQKEIELAGKVQKKILPVKVPENKNFDIDFFYQPCFTIGGDFFYFIPLKDNRLGVFLADVVGHGVHAALITMIIKTLLETNNQFSDDPKALLEYLNEQLISILGGKFTYITAEYSLIDIDNGIIKYATAGHPAAFLCRKGEIKELKAKGFVLGLFEDAKFTNNVEKIEKDDQILFYTDGAYEVENENHDIFGDEELKEILKNNYKKSSKEINDTILKELNNFKGEAEFPDDINLISIKILK